MGWLLTSRICLVTDPCRWHADIKPENIIFVRGKYKLADPGFARFKKKLQDTGAAPPEIRIHGGTDTYGTLEFHQCPRNG